ncbi:MAG: hypothetical protein ABSH34_22910 [Verrucomicrobiota bacterium]|jgi:hypothetical protein
MKKLDQYCVKSVGPLSRCSKLSALILVGLVAWAGAAGAATNTVTVNDDGLSNIGAPGTFYWAITNCNAGDTIAFAIPGAGPHYLQEPPGGFPLVYKKHNLLIDGYTQPGSSPNTHSITQANNAVINIVVDGRNGNSRGMDYSTFDGTTAASVPPIDNTSMANEQSGFGNSERALLPIYRSTNVTVRGLAFLSTFSDPNGDQKGICLAHDYGLVTDVLDRLAYTNGSDANCHVCGCWFGVDPTNQTVAGVAGGLMAIANYRHRDANGGSRPDLPNVGLIVGVAPGSSNPRAEFNVFVGYGYMMDSENIRARFSGNFVGVMPDGVTAYNMPDIDPTDFGNAGNGHFEWGRYDDTEPMIIGTDGDGVNDADEGNLFGPLDLYNNGTSQANIFDFYSTGRKPYIIAGNRFGIAVDGTPWVNNSFTIFGGLSLNQGTQVRFGSDFNGVSDGLEANIVYNNNVFSTVYPAPAGSTAPSLFQGMNSSSVTTDAWVSVRGNVFVNNFPTFNPDDSSASHFVDWWSNYVAYAVATPDATNAIPTLSATSTVSKLIGTFGGTTTNGYTNLVLDLYLPDPEGQTNGAQFDLPSFGGNGSSSSGWGFVQGKTYLGSYVIPNPASGAFSLDISGLGLAHKTAVTAAITYSAFPRPIITSITRSGTNTTLVWTGSNGGPFMSDTAGGPSSGFGVQRASSLAGPWTTSFAPANSIVLTDTGSMVFYRIVSPLSGMTTLCAPPVTLP